MCAGAGEDDTAVVSCGRAHQHSLWRDLRYPDCQE